MTHEYGTVIDSLRQRLLDRRRAIVGRVARTDDVLGELDQSTPAEAEEEAQELNQARIVAQLGQRSRAELDAIDVAIDLMERGDYGFCEECEEPIDVARLEVLPTARGGGRRHRRGLLSAGRQPPFAAGTNVRHGCPRRPGQGGSACGTFTPGTTGSTIRDA